MRAARPIKLVAWAVIGGCALAGADTALGPAVNFEGGFPAPGKLAAGAAYVGDYGPLYVRISGAYAPMPSSKGGEGYADWPPGYERDDRGYASCEALGAYFLGETAAFGPGLYYRFGRGVKEYYSYTYGATLTLHTEDYVAFQHDFYAVAAYRLRAEQRGTAILWGGVGASRFLRNGLLYSWYSDYYNPEYTYDETTSLDTRLTALAAGMGGDFRTGFARHFGIYACTRFLFPLADINLGGFDGNKPEANAALAGGCFVGW